MNSTTDSALFEQIRSGNSQAFTQLYERYRVRLRRYCARLLNDEQSAEDVVQNVFIKLHSERETIRSGQSIQSWIFTVARNEAFGELRKGKLDPIDEEIVWEGTLPDEELQNRERKEIIDAALQHLHAPFREVIVLREYERLSYEEIASIMDTTISSVKSRLFKARKALIEKLKPYL